MKILKVLLLSCFCSVLNAGVLAPTPIQPCPNETQMRWQEMEMYAFVHFSMNTFTDIEWGYGDVDPKAFNPTALDCNQWAEVCKKAGLKGIILTAKHHDGFCLWPTKTTEYSVKNSPWRDGKGDLVREVADACKKHGLKLGIYLSPWDRNYPNYGKPEYVKAYHEQLRELLTNYGDVFEVWCDGANGGSGFYGGAREVRKIDNKTYYQWDKMHAIVRELQPGAVIFSDGGPDVRWCGNEEGWVGETNWSPLQRERVSPGWSEYPELRYGHEDGKYWVPAEVDVSIRPGWFYHASEDSKVKSVGQLMDIYYQSVGRNGNLLLNFPVDKRGLIHETDAARVVKMGETIRKDFSKNMSAGAKATASNVRGDSSDYAPDKLLDGDKNSYWATDDGVTSASVILDMGEPKMINRFLVQENIRLGQRVKGFTVEAVVDGEWKELAKGTTIGYKRIFRFPEVKTSQVRFSVTDSRGPLAISNMGLYLAPRLLNPPVLRRSQSGEVSILSPDRGLELYYTQDGSEPTTKSGKYEKPFMLDGKADIRAICHDPVTGGVSDVAREQFDIPRAAWKIVGTDDSEAARILDGAPATAWCQKKADMPIDLTVDLGQEYKVKGIKYLPDQGEKASGVIFQYEVSASDDGKTWVKADAGEFSNIRNNPVMQTKTFAPVKARFIRLRALSNTSGDAVAGYAEFNIITE